MGSRTRAFCPTCRTTYQPYARECAACGRMRDQKTDAEMEDEWLPKAAVAASKPGPAMSPRNIAYLVLGLFGLVLLLTRPAAAITLLLTAALVMANRSALRKLVIGGIGGVLFLAFLGGASTTRSAPPVPAATVPAVAPVQVQAPYVPPTVESAPTQVPSPATRPDPTQPGNENYATPEQVQELYAATGRNPDGSAKTAQPVASDVPGVGTPGVYAPGASFGVSHKRRHYSQKYGR